MRLFAALCIIIVGLAALPGISFGADVKALLAEANTLFRSYARGAVPENGYAMDPDNYELVIERTVEGHPKGLQLYLRSGGADYPRVIYMKEVNGFWFIADGSTVKVEVRPPRK